MFKFLSVQLGSIILISLITGDGSYIDLVLELDQKCELSAQQADE